MGKKGNLIEHSEYNNDEQPDDEDAQDGAGPSLIDLDVSYGTPPAGNTIDPFGFLNAPQPTQPRPADKVLLLSAEQGNGLEIRGAFQHKAGQTTFCIALSNRSSAPMNGFMVSFNKNAFRLKPVSTVMPVQVLSPGQTTDIEVPLTADGEAVPATTSLVQIAVKNNVSVFYMTADCPLHIFFANDGALAKNHYLQLWAELEATEQASMMAANNILSHIISNLQAHNVFLIAQKNLEQDVLYLSTKIVVPGVFGGEVALIELTIQGTQCKCCIRVGVPLLVPLISASIAQLVA